MARTVQLGKPEQKKIDAMKATNEALNAGIEATKPGNTADDVAQKFWGEKNTASNSIPSSPTNFKSSPLYCLSVFARKKFTLNTVFIGILLLL